MEIRPYLVQNKADSGTRSFSANRAQAQKQCLDLVPFNIAIHWLCKDRLERFSVLAAHKAYDIILCYRHKGKITVVLNVPWWSS